MQDYILYIALAGLALSLIAVGLLLMLEMRLKKLFGGSEAKRLEDVLAGLHKELQTDRENIKEADKRIADLDKRVGRSIQSIRTIRFNPFHDSGSNQSFSVVLADEKGDGVVLSSLHARERMSIYAKPIKEFSSMHELTEEEQQIIKERQAINNL